MRAIMVPAVAALLFLAGLMSVPGDLWQRVGLTNAAPALILSAGTPANDLPFVMQRAVRLPFVVDPADTRRGPYSDVPINFHGGNELIHSPFHTKGRFCGQCHDVSTPTYTKMADGTYALNTLGSPHPTAQADEMFSVLMGEDVESRRNFIQQNARDVRFLDI